MDDLGKRITLRKRELDGVAGEARSVLLRGKAIQDEIKKLIEDIEVYDKTNILLNSLGEDKQDQAQATIESLVTRGLQKIFDSSMSFHIKRVTRTDSQAGCALPARLVRLLTVESGSENTGGRGLAYTMNTGEQKTDRDTVLLDHLLQDHGRRLSLNIFKPLGTVLNS